MTHLYVFLVAALGAFVDFGPLSLSRLVVDSDPAPHTSMDVHCFVPVAYPHSHRTLTDLGGLG